MITPEKAGAGPRWSGEAYESYVLDVHPGHSHWRTKPQYQNFEAQFGEQMQLSECTRLTLGSPVRANTISAD